MFINPWIPGSFTSPESMILSHSFLAFEDPSPNNHTEFPTIAEEISSTSCFCPVHSSSINDSTFNGIHWHSKSSTKNIPSSLSILRDLFQLVLIQSISRRRAMYISTFEHLVI